MANPTQIVNTLQIDFGQMTHYWPLVAGSVNAKTYQTGQMIGIFTSGGNAGYATDFDNSAAKKFAGIVVGNHVQVDSGDASGAKYIRVAKPQYITLKKTASGTVSRATDLGKPCYAVNADDFAFTLAEGATNSNLIGYLEDILTTNENLATLTSNYALIRCAYMYQAVAAS